MDKDAFELFSMRTSALMQRARLAHKAAKKGDIKSAKIELARTMTNLVNLFGILNGE